MKDIRQKRLHSIYTEFSQIWTKPVTKKQSVGNWRSGGEVPVGQGNILLVMVGFAISVIGMVSPAFLCPDLSDCTLLHAITAQ